MSSTEHVEVSLSASSSNFKILFGFCFKYALWFPGQMFLASLRMMEILLILSKKSVAFQVKIHLQMARNNINIYIVVNHR